jgi:hexosaminidase
MCTADVSALRRASPGIRPVPPRAGDFAIGRYARATLCSVALALTAIGLHAAGEPVKLALMPAPAELRVADGRLAINRDFSIAITATNDERLRNGLARAVRRWEERTGLTFAHTADGAYALVANEKGANATLAIECVAAGAAIPAVGEDESYTLEISATQATLRSANVVGALRGLETLLQLLQSDAEGWFLPAMTIRDQPRFPWRGLLIDVARHWQPIDVIKRNLDGMALVKLNVLHLHLTEDQGFRVESKTFPRLHQLGSDGKYFTQDQIREIIAYAAARGIRVVPEFDIPGHATSWVVGYPELASAPGPYAIERRWGVFDPVLDPTNEKTYELLEGFLGEMAALFPDPFLHIGGDENNGKQWSANPRIQAFIREHGLKNNEGLHAYFNGRVREILAKHGKKMIGWDEILHPDLPKDSVIHSWRGAAGLVDAARRGYTAILSNGYYIDLIQPTWKHYLNDPLPTDTPLTPEEQKRIIGGEATMWSEWVTPETIDSRIWPRTAAIAERLWSPRDVKDVPDMYRRLAVLSRRLDEAGLQHEKNRPAMLRRFTGDKIDESGRRPLQVLADLGEPVKQYQRGHQQPNTTQFSPLTTFADITVPDSASSREFNQMVDAYLFGATRDADLAARLKLQLETWREVGREISSTLAARSPRVKAIAPLAQALVTASEIGLQVLAGNSATPAENGAKAQLAALTLVARPVDAVELPIISGIRQLVAGADLEPRRASLPPAEWRREVEQRAAVPVPRKAAP